MPNIKLLLLTAFGLLCGLDTQSAAIKLEEFQVFNLNSPQPIEPSGLTLMGGQLFTVCDDTPAIFKINLIDETTAEAVVHQQLNVHDLSVTNLDLEGISVVDGEFFLASEVHHKLIRVGGDQFSWVPESAGVYTDAYKAGLFQLYNAGMEAVVYLGNQTFLLSVEREPRGLIEVSFDATYQTIINQTNQVFDDSKYPLLASRKPDLAGLYVHQDVIYALHRNAYIIHELIKDEQGLYQEGRAWSYEHIVKDSQHAYQNMQFGHAEGLAVDDNYFYLVLDNNKKPRLKNPNDSRPLLIKAKRK